MGVVVMPLAQS